MPTAGEAFTKVMGKPAPAAPSGVKLGNFFGQSVWETVHAETGAGWFRDGFLYLFGEGLETLLPCVESWSFLLPPATSRIVIGRNAYGALLLAENTGEHGWAAPVGMLDPLQVRYFTDRELTFASLVARWLPEDLLPGFLDSSLYDAWVKVKSERLELGEILGIREPLSLGGTMEAANFQIEDIVEYYRTTGPIYREALKKGT